MDQDQLNHLIKQNHLDAQAGDILALAQEAIRLIGSPVQDAQAQPGSSRLGGAPDVPGTFIWPQWQNIPMSFVAQIRLADIARFPPARGLPGDGQLLIFYNAAQDTYGEQPSDRGSWSVLYLSPGQSLQPAGFPARLPQTARFKPLALQFSSQLTLPVDPRQVNPGLKWSEDVTHRYEQLLNSIQSPEEKKIPRHQMFGTPDQLQDDMQLQSALVSQGITASGDPRAAAAGKQKGDWQLLLQVDSDDRAGMLWGSYGLIYYWLRDQDIKARQFSQAWLVQQSD